MIAFVTGTLDTILEHNVILDNNGIGYTISLSLATIAKLPPQGSEIKIYTYTSMKDDGITLVGFLSLEEVLIFNKLISVSGIGPKGGMAILSTLTPSDIILAIVTEDSKLLSSAPGVGLKTAKRLILELKDKIKTKDELPTIKNNTPSISKDTIDALVVLGYSYKEASTVVKELQGTDITLEETIKLALSKLITL